jgi:futalosine hydrolase
MRILIVAATWMEVNLLTDELVLVGEKNHFFKNYKFQELAFDILITGIGVVFSTFHLTNALKENQYDIVLNVGISGSLTKELEIGEVVNVISEEFGDLGIENKNEFLTLFEAGFLDFNEFPFDMGILKPEFVDVRMELKRVRGITTNKSHGKNSSITGLNEKFAAQVESMEGAAIFYVCNWIGIPCCQIRAISNYVEPRDSAHWDIPLALDNLKQTILSLLTEFPVLAS